MLTIEEAKAEHRSKRKWCMAIARGFKASFEAWGAEFSRKCMRAAVADARIHNRRLLSVMRAEKFLASPAILGMPPMFSQGENI